jgi:hypothetical protein
MGGFICHAVAFSYVMKGYLLGVSVGKSDQVMLGLGCYRWQEYLRFGNA